jgi:D,D-heptose 1,7-bisphosphate phosphatase
MKAVFLDRDGVINNDKYGYVNNPDQFELFPWVPKAIEELNLLGFLVFVVTNQGGIARGYFTEQDLEKIHAKMLLQLKEKNAFINDIFYSPFYKEGTVEPYNIYSDCRKPGLGMFNKALKKYDFTIKESFMFGDRYSDIVFGKKAGLNTILVRSGLGEKEFLENRTNWEHKPDFIVDNLYSGVNLIKKLQFND